MSAPDLSIVILSWNTKELTRKCIQAVQRDGSKLEREIIVVDNGSHDGSADMVAEEFPEVLLVRNRDNLLYAEGNNQGAKRATGRFLCTLNSDTEVELGALDKLVRFLEENPDYGVVAPQLKNFDGTPQRAVLRFPGLSTPIVDSTLFGEFPPGSWLLARQSMAKFDHAHSRDVDQPPAAVWVVAREEYVEMGGLDESLSLFFNDVDFCWRIKRERGRKVYFLAEAGVFHHQGASTRSLADRNRNTYWFANRETFYAKHWGGFGRLWVRFALRLWAFQVSSAIRLGPRSKAEKKEALADIRSHVSRSLAANANGDAMPVRSAESDLDAVSDPAKEPSR
ncbi:MAG: glycosyltransferase family 2 protein [Planctomycetota bacterium]